MNSEMQIEYDYIDGIINQLSEMDLKHLSKLLKCVSQEIISRIPGISIESEKNLAKSTLLSVKSLLFFFEVKLPKKSDKPEDYIPHRANELIIYSTNFSIQFHTS